MLEAMIAAVLLERPEDPGSFMLRRLGAQLRSCDLGGFSRWISKRTVLRRPRICSSAAIRLPFGLKALAKGEQKDEILARLLKLLNVPGRFSCAMELAQIAAEVSELLQNSRSMDNKRETIFELLRRSCLKSARTL